MYLSAIPFLFMTRMFCSQCAFRYSRLYNNKQETLVYSHSGISRMSANTGQIIEWSVSDRKTICKKPIFKEQVLLNNAECHQRRIWLLMLNISHPKSARLALISFLFWNMQLWEKKNSENISEALISRMRKTWLIVHTKSLIKLVCYY